jgi:acetyltransferase-like isoleucine patch superfamily enzyme
MASLPDITPSQELATEYPGVCLGLGTDIERPSLIGKPPRGATFGELELRIGDASTIRAFTTMYAGTIVGDRFQTGHGVLVREDNVIGDDVSIGTNAVLEAGNRIGNRVRVHSGCFLEMVTVEDDVFIAPNVVFADDPHPPCPRYKDCVRGAVVKRGARIGSNSTILPGVVIGMGALVGAGSVVVEDVPDGMVVVGSPARVLKRVDELTCQTGLMDKPYGASNEQVPLPVLPDPTETHE